MYVTEKRFTDEVKELRQEMRIIIKDFQSALDEQAKLIKTLNVTINLLAEDIRQLQK